MRKISLPKISKTHPIAFWIAVILHLALLASLIFSSIQQWEIEQKKPKKSNSKPIPKAIVIDLKEFQKEKQRIIDSEKQKSLKIKRDEKHIKDLEKERYKKQKNLNRLKAKTKQAHKKTKEAEKKKKKAEKQKKLAEQKAKEAEKKKKAIEKQRKKESKRFKKEQNKRALTKEIQTEEDQERQLAQENILNELKVNYVNQIASQVQNQWRPQLGAKNSWGCKVRILQDLNGNVKSVNITSCNVDDKTKEKPFKDSIERAVYKASPLPNAPDKNVFDREIDFHFRVK